MLAYPLGASVAMRGSDEQQAILFSYRSIEDRIPSDHPLRALRRLVDPVLAVRSPRFQTLYAGTGRPSIPPEQLLRALLLQVLYTIRSERQLMEQLDYNLLYRWFVGLTPDDAVWVPTVFTKHRDRLLDGNIAEAFFNQVLVVATDHRLLSHEHCTVRRHAGRARRASVHWPIPRGRGERQIWPGPPRSDKIQQRF